MKIKLDLICIFFFIGSISFAQSSNWIWNQSSLKDFSENSLNNLINSNDEIRISPAIKKIIPDYRNESVNRFIDRNLSGTLVKCWINGSSIYTQKFNANGIKISEILEVNDSNRFVGDQSKYRCSIMNDGFFIVTWLNNGYNSDRKLYGQIFDNKNRRVGSNFAVNNSLNNTGDLPFVFNNEPDNTFWILYSYRVDDDYENVKIYVQKVSKTAEKIEEPFFLETGGINNFEQHPSVACDKDNNFIVTWFGSNSGNSVSADIYSRKYNSLGQPLSTRTKVNDEINMHGALSPEIAIDNNANYLITWVDDRDRVETSGLITSGIYGQYFNSNDERVGRNFKINDSQNKYNSDIDVNFLNESFQVSYLSFNNISWAYEVYVNSWKFEPNLTGEMISIVYDTGPGGAVFDEIFWEKEIPAGSSIKFTLRSSPKKEDINDLAWHGPNNENEFYLNSESEKINSLHDGDRFIQFKSILSSNINLESPSLYSISISYIPSDTVAPTIPKNLTGTPGHSKIDLCWDANSDSDIAYYKIYRGIISESYETNFTIKTTSQHLNFIDTTVISGNTYYYAVSAIDSSKNESELSTEVAKTPIGKTYYVNEDNNNPGDGSLINPYHLISQAMDNSVFGDKIIVLPGIYEENITIKMGVSLSSSGIEPAILQSINEEIMIQMNPYSNLEGFVIIQNHSGLVILAEGVGISIIRNNIISEVEGSPGTAILCRNTEVEISQNYISSFYSGIQGSGGMNTIMRSNFEIHNNIIKCFWGISFLEDCVAEIYNNTIIFGNEKGEYGRGVMTRFSDDLIVKNNIFVSETKEYGVVIKNDGSTSTTITSSYNNFWDHSTKYDGPVNELLGCLNLDPLFENFNNNDFRLKGNSPCIDAGDPQGKYYDIDSTRNDMGAYGGREPFNKFNNLETIKKLSVQNCSGFPGDTISTFIMLDTPNNLYSATIDIEFEPSILTYIETKLTDASINFNYKDALTYDNYISITMDGDINDNYDNNSILELSFIVNNTVTSGDASPLTIKKTDLIDKSLNTIYLTSITDGVFVVNLGSQEGQYVFVDINSTKTQNGSRTNPFNSVQDAIDFSSHGDTIIVAPGEYFGPFTMKDSTFLRGSGASVTELNIDFDLYFGIPVVSFHSINHSKISGFTIHSKEFIESASIYCDNSSPVITENYFIAPFINAESAALICNHQSNPLVKRNTTENCKIIIFNSNPNIRNNTLRGAAGGMSSLSINDNSSPIVSQNTIYSSIGGGAGISIFNSSPTIENNMIIFEDHNGQGLYFNNSDSCIVRNNLIFDSNDDGMGLFINNSTNMNIYNNTISTKQSGIWSTASSGFIYNNIITNNKLFGIQAPGFTYINYNCLWNNSTNYENTTIGGNDVFLDPLFENTNSNLFHLTENSPCINAGNPNLEFNDTDKSRNDIGAYGGSSADLNWIEYENSRLEIINENKQLSDTIHVVINGSNISKIADIELSLSYDSGVLEFLNAESTDLTKSFSISKSLGFNNIVDLDLVSRNGITSDSGSVILLSFLNIAESSTKTYLNFSKANLVDDVLSNRSISQLKDGEINIIVTNVKMENIPTNFYLAQNYPNPFNPTTIIKYDLPQKSFVELKIYDILGRQVHTLVNEEKLAGTYQVDFNSNNLASGVYFYRIKTGDFTKVKKMILLR